MKWAMQGLNFEANFTKTTKYFFLLALMGVLTCLMESFVPLSTTLAQIDLKF
jgi:hypothetical protein